MEKLGVGVTCRLAGFFGKSWFLLYRKLINRKKGVSPAKFCRFGGFDGI
jgi:hypothetical protein